MDNVFCFFSKAKERKVLRQILEAFWKEKRAKEKEREKR